MNGYYEKLQTVLAAGGSVITAAAIASSKDSQRKTLDRALYDGKETHCTDAAQQSFWTDFFANLDRKQPFPRMEKGDGKEIFLEKICAHQRLILCGGGHIAAPLCKIGAMLDFDVTVIDDRAEFIGRDRFPDAKELICKPFTEAFDNLSYGENCYFVIITRGHKDDRLCLEHVLQNRFGYVGMIGSRRKVSIVMEQLVKDGYSRDLIAQVHSPIGLRIGAQTPAEIAVCIAAELIQHRAGVSDSSYPPEVLGRLAAGEPMALATILSKTGSAPRAMGAKLLLDREYILYGTVGGGAGEAAVIEAAKEVLETGEVKIAECNMTNRDAQQSGMVCGGVLQVLIERTV